MAASSAADAAVFAPVPAEPTPPLAARVAEAPAFEAKLVADKAYLAIWAPAHAGDRAIFLTALSDFIAYGTPRKETAKAMRTVGLMPAFDDVKEVLARTGELPSELKSKVEAGLAETKQAPRLGLWKPDDAGANVIDETALAMWLHPNDPAYVRERLVALVKGPSTPLEGQPVARAWLANLGDVINRLHALDGFGKDECLVVGAEWTEKVSPQTGASTYACTPKDESKRPNLPLITLLAGIAQKPAAHADKIQDHSLRDDPKQTIYGADLRPALTGTSQLDELKGHPGAWEWVLVEVHKSLRPEQLSPTGSVKRLASEAPEGDSANVWYQVMDGPLALAFVRNVEPDGVTGIISLEYVRATNHYPFASALCRDGVASCPKQ